MVYLCIEWSIHLYIHACWDVIDVQGIGVMVECSRVMVECSHVRLGSRLTADVWIYVASCLSICYTYYIYPDTMMCNYMTCTDLYQKLMHACEGQARETISQLNG